MGELAEKEFNRPGGIFLTWMGVLVGPFAFLLNLQLSYMLVPWACVSGQVFWLHVAAGASLLLALLGLSLAWRAHRKSRDGRQGEGGSAAARSHFMATLGLLMSSLFALIILAQWTANFIIGPCQL